MSRELLELELGALKKDRVSTEKKLELLAGRVNIEGEVWACLLTTNLCTRQSDVITREECGIILDSGTVAENFAVLYFIVNADFVSSNFDRRLHG